MVASPLIFDAISKHTATVIFLHGLGDTGYGWSQPVSAIFRKDPGLSHIKWVLPHAPSVPVTANSGLTMPAWFDIRSFDFSTDEDEVGMLSTVSYINQLISAEVDSGIDPGQIVVGGFSQGAAMSLLCGLANERQLGGVVSLSGWLVLRNKIKAMCSSHATSNPIFWGHGTADPLVKFALGRDSVDFLKNTLGLPEVPNAVGATTLKGITFKPYDGLGHGADPQELDDLAAWLKMTLDSLPA
ncbi:Phospholipase/carboxylesterase/thioesterase [Lactarius vividus]|nr:Phospholipase/carboxylesterase/thioesterase [Lactarius vividus]